MWEPDMIPWLSGGGLTFCVGGVCGRGLVIGFILTQPKQKDLNMNIGISLLSRTFIRHTTQIKQLF